MKEQAGELQCTSRQKPRKPKECHETCHGSEDRACQPRIPYPEELSFEVQQHVVLKNHITYNIHFVHY